MNLTFPAFGRGNFEGNDLKFEVGGFADGVDPRSSRTTSAFASCSLTGTPTLRSASHRVRAGVGRLGSASRQPFPRRRADGGSAAAPGRRFRARPKRPIRRGDPVAEGPAEEPLTPVPAEGRGRSDAGGIDPAQERRDQNPRPISIATIATTRPCAASTGVLIVMSPTMIELYNGQFAKSHGLPIIETDFVNGSCSAAACPRCASRSASVKRRSPAATRRSHRPRRVEGVLVGMSNKAMPIGMTVPIQYIQRWNEQYMGKEAATTYSSIIVTLKDRNQIAPFAQWLQDSLDLRLEDSLGEKFATVLFVIRLVLILISLVIIGISAINIAHNFFMQVTERRRELGLLRALGATQGDVRRVVLGEAALIGLIGGILGVLLGMALAKGVDYASAHYLPRFPYKPATWFDFKWWIWGGGLACAAGFAVLGGYLPARRASTMEPAQALTQN